MSYSYYTRFLSFMAGLNKMTDFSIVKRVLLGKYTKGLSFTVAAFFCTLAITPDYQRSYLGAPNTNAQIKRARGLIKLFRKEYRRVPKNLSELRHFSYQRKRVFTPYDGYAQRLFYKNFTDRSYLIWSLPNATKRGKAPEKGHISTNIPNFYKPILVQPDPLTPKKLYPAIFLAGLKHKKNNYVARVFRNTTNNEKTLLVQDISNKHILFLADHPGVEEILWLNKDVLIYTATGDSLRKDNIYAWHIKTGATTPLLGEDYHTKGPSPFATLKSDKTLFLSLAGKNKNKVFAYVAERNSHILNPMDFMSPRNLVELSFDKKGRLIAVKKGENIKETAQDKRPFFKAAQKKLGSKSQRVWSSLPLDGSPQHIIESWQNFSIKYSRSPLFPYSLFCLSVLYHDVHQSLKASVSTHKEAHALRSFGAEIAESLFMVPAAPSYLKAYGHHMWSSLKKEENLEFSLATF